jgi:hypothetical protein
MTTEAISVILDKAWELNSRAFIYVRNELRYSISKNDYDWKIYDDITILCIYNKTTNAEHYIDAEYISEIDIEDDSRGD